MAQTKRKRRRKHKGTQGGSIDTGRRSSRPRSREEAKARARSRRKPATRGDAPPTWRSAIIRGVVAAVIFTAFLLFLFNRSVGEALGLGGFMLLFYVPGGFYFDTLMWRKRERARIRATEERNQ
jgi:hypothetical protein